MVNKSRILNDSAIDWVRSVPAVRWIFLAANILVNIVLTLIAVGVFTPWITHFILGALGNTSAIPWRYILIGLNTNSPWILLFSAPVAVISLILPLYGKSNFLIVLRGAQSIAAWSQAALALATCMWMGQIAINTHRIEGKSISFFVYFGFATAFILFFQAICMCVLAWISWLTHILVIKKRFEKKHGERFKNRDYKLLAIFYQGFDAALVLIFMVYVGLHTYEYFSRPDGFYPGFNKVFFEVPLVVIFGIGGIFNLVFSVASIIIIIYGVVTKNNQYGYGVSVTAFNCLSLLVYGVVFFIVVIILVTTTFVFEMASGFPFFPSLFAIGALGLFKIVTALASVDVSHSNSKMTVDVLRDNTLTYSFLHDINDI